MRIVMHGHHADSLFSYFADEWEVAKRRKFIKTDKPRDEWELRLALLRDVTDLLPHTEAWVDWNKAWVKLDKARVEWGKARMDWNKTWVDLDKARVNYDKALVEWNKTWAEWDRAREEWGKSFDSEAFHREHCRPNCPWDGTTIFAKGKSIEVLV